ncbi:MAG: protein kinase [Pseudomonadota bacterium]
MISAGQQLGGYTILRRIGTGGMGEVFLAQHRRVARRAAIKALIPELSAKEAVLEHFFKEARNTSLIRHPGIIEILDCDVHEGQAFIIMEFLEGESLGTYLKRNGALDSDMAFLLGLVAEVGGAVAAAHAAGIMHRDLKPENIYLHLAGPTDPTVSVKVLDFGIAKLSRDDGGPSKTKSGVMLGSPTYMSPEQCRGVGRPDARSDIYSLGCVLYEALCGQPPFPAKGVGELIVAHLTEPPKAPVKLVPDVPPKLNSLLLKMLAKAPDDRPQTMNQVVETLRECARALGIDFEGALQPLSPVERPVHLFAPPAAASPGAKDRAEQQSEDRSQPFRAPAPPPVAAPPPSSGPVRAAAVPASPPVATRPFDGSSAPPVVARSPVFGPPPAVNPAGASPGEAAARPIPATLPMAIPAPALPHAAAVGPRAGGPGAGAPGNAVGGTMILGAAGPATAPVERDGTGGRPPLNALAGGTMILPPQEGLPLGGPPARHQDARTPHPFVGGTMILETHDDAAPRRAGISADSSNEEADDERNADSGGDEGDDQNDGNEDDVGADEPLAASDDRRHIRRHKPGRAAVTVRSRSSTEQPWYSAILQSRPRLMLIVGGVVVLVGAALSAMLAGTGRPTPPESEAPPPAIHGVEQAAPPPQEPVPPPAPMRPTSTSPAARPAATAPAVSETVTIDIEGAPAGTEITIDDRAAALPLRVPRGRSTHRILIRPPGGSARSIEVDGTRDRVIELVVDPPPAPRAPAPRPPAAPRPAAHAATPPTVPAAAADSTPRKAPAGPTAPSPAPTKKKSTAASKDREAITDI